MPGSPSFTVEGVRFVTKVDLALQAGQDFFIYDWKTSLSYPSASGIENGIQSRLYPLVLVMAGNRFIHNHKTVQPEQVKMNYWYSNYPSYAQQIVYSQSRFDEDKLFIEELIGSICAKKPGQFRMTENALKCRYCTYQTLCDRNDLLEGYPAENPINPGIEVDVLLGIQSIGDSENWFDA